MNKSSIEWYAEQLENLQYNPLEKNGYENAKNKILEQAKAMHKQEIIQTHFNAQEFNAMMLHSASEYYKSVFEKL